ncbi:MAG: hypothetical protein RL660_2924 [Bacteroidota bacterium]|jgi:uncharacterized protein
MTNFIPIFPLNIVVYPGEQLNLHIFELRYQQLINECITQEKPFGLPTVIGNNLQEIGVVLDVVELSNRYTDGKLDIKSTAKRRFRILEYVERVPEKLYSGAIVFYLDDEPSVFQRKQSLVIDKLFALHERLGVKKDYKKPREELLSYDIAHHIGLSLQQEYDLQCLNQEAQRLEYISRHLDRLAIDAQNSDTMVKRIRLNGEFRSLSLDIDDFNFTKV